MAINIITSFYISINKQRQKELNKSLEQNIKNKLISGIHLFLDDDKCLNFLEKKYKSLIKKKIYIIKIGKQPLYSDLFEYANTLKNKMCMIINSDIWLHSVTDINLLHNIKNKIYALTRHEHNMTCRLINRYMGSHDAFIFMSPINEQIIKHIKHPQNVWGSENVVLYELNKLKYTIYNPCRQIIIVHEHRSQIRDNCRQRINRGDIDGDGIYKIRSFSVKPIQL